MTDQRGYNGTPLCLPSRPPHEYGPGIRPKDATDKEARTPRSRGRSVVVLYNSVRTHRSLNKDAPVSRQIQRTGVISSRAILGGLEVAISLSGFAENLTRYLLNSFNEHSEKSVEFSLKALNRLAGDSE